MINVLNVNLGNEHYNEILFKIAKDRINRHRFVFLQSIFLLSGLKDDDGIEPKGQLL